MVDALGFLGRQLSPPAWGERSVLDFRSGLEQSKRAAGIEIEQVDPPRLNADKAAGMTHRSGPREAGETGRSGQGSRRCRRGFVSA